MQEKMQFVAWLSRTNIALYGLMIHQSDRSDEAGIRAKIVTDILAVTINGISVQWNYYRQAFNGTRGV